MSSVNRAILLGHLGRDLSSVTDVNGDQCATTSLATTFKWRDKATGEHKESTEWHNLVFPPDLAEVAMHELRKGSQAWITGRLHTRRWTGRGGVERQALQIIVETFQDMSNTGKTYSSAAQDYYAQPR